jgi:hypothetical protein
MSALETLAFDMYGTLIDPTRRAVYCGALATETA